jgi:hypothetical protein
MSMIQKQGGGVKYASKSSYKNATEYVAYHSVGMTKPLQRGTENVGPSLRGGIHLAGFIYVSITRSTRRNAKQQTYLSITGLFRVRFGMRWRKRRNLKGEVG